MKINESTLKQIIEESVKNVLKESFNDNELTQAIKEHGGIHKSFKDIGTFIHGNFDLQNAKYEGYLNKETLRELLNTHLYSKVAEWVIWTNDGGAIVVSENMSMDRNFWNKKVKQRNQKWGVNSDNKEDFQSNGWRRETESSDFISPKNINTFTRRLDRKRK